MKYELLTAADSSLLKTAVARAIEAGWEPQGGVSLAVWTEQRRGPHGGEWQDTCYQYTQAMVYLPKPAYIGPTLTDEELRELAASMKDPGQWDGIGLAPDWTSARYRK